MILLPQKKTYSISGHQLDFSKIYAVNLRSYCIFFPINLKKTTFVDPHRGGILSQKVEFLVKIDVFQRREAPILAGSQSINRQQKVLVCDTENLRIVYETRENIFSFDIRLKLIG